MIVKELQHLATPIDQLKPLPGNPRKGDIDAVARSYERFGQRKPIVCTTDGTVIAGNHQLLAAKKLGWTEIAVVQVDDDEQTAKAFALADNRTADLGSYDDTLLAELLADVANDLDLLTATGYTTENIDDLMAKMSDKDLDGSAVHIAEKYEVIVECEDELQQESLLLRFSQEGLKVRAIII